MNGYFYNDQKILKTGQNQTYLWPTMGNTLNIMHKIMTHVCV